MATTFGQSITSGSGSSNNNEQNNDNGITLRSLAVAAVDDDGGAYSYVGSGSRYNEYSDDKLSFIDDLKNISVDESQINVTQETRSQYIPFRLPRYYDGIDLSRMSFQIHFVNSNNEEHRSSPVDVQANSKYIIFAWLVDANATAVAGEVKFEIEARGVNEKGEDYVWKTRPNGRINVIESLSGNGMIEPDADWYTSFVNQMDQKIAEAQQAAQTAQSAAEQASQVVTNYYNKSEIDQMLENLDLTDFKEEIEAEIAAIDGLADFDVTYDAGTRVMTFYNGSDVIKSFTLNSDPTTAWITSYTNVVDNKISTAVTNAKNQIDSDIADVNSDLQSIHNAIDDLPETLSSDYYTKTDTDDLLDGKLDKTTFNNLNTEFGVVKNTVSSHTTSISTLGQDVETLKAAVNNQNSKQTYTYDATYSNENVFTLWEVKNEGESTEERTAKASFTISGGGGGSSASTTVKITPITTQPLIVLKGEDAVIRFMFQSLDSEGQSTGGGSAVWRLDNAIIANTLLVEGENAFDLTDYLSVGTRNVTLTATDVAGTIAVKRWVVQIVDIRLESSFSDAITYPMGDVNFTYTPYGSISKVVHFILDNTELPSVTTGSSGVMMQYVLPAQDHGAHLLKTYITATVNNVPITTPTITKDIVWYDAESKVPVISTIYQDFTAIQYDTTNIVFNVFDPNTETPTVSLFDNDTLIRTETLSSTSGIWAYNTSDIGEHTLKIKCRDVEKELHVVITKLDIDVEPVTAGLVLDFNPVGKSNNSEDKLWTNGTYSMTVSDNFDWVNGGYQFVDGEQLFCIKSGTRVYFDYHMFEDDAKRNGKEFKIIFKTTKVARADATFFKCVDGVDNNRIGYQMNVHEAYMFCNSAKNLYMPYSEEDIIEFEFNINKDTDITMVMSYEDGTPYRPLIYNADNQFSQLNPKIIEIGSDYCDVYIYRMKCYETSLTTKDILSNFIADARSAGEMLDRYRRNDIYDENNELTPEHLAEVCPDLRILKIECPYFTNNKSDYVKYTNVECIYKNGDPVLDNWIFRNGYHAGQGTTSNEYGAAGRNIDIIFGFDGVHQIVGKIPFESNYISTVTLGDGTVLTGNDAKIALTRNSVPNDWFNIKVK